MRILTQFGLGIGVHGTAGSRRASLGRGQWIILKKVKKALPQEVADNLGRIEFDGIRPSHRVLWHTSKGYAAEMAKCLNDVLGGAELHHNDRVLKATVRQCKAIEHKQASFGRLKHFLEQEFRQHRWEMDWFHFKAKIGHETIACLDPDGSVNWDEPLVTNLLSSTKAHCMQALAGHRRTT